jgi:dihydroorotase
VTLLEQSWALPPELPFGEHTLVPLGAAAPVTWRLAGE